MDIDPKWISDIIEAFNDANITERFITNQDKTTDNLWNKQT